MKILSLIPLQVMSSQSLTAVSSIEALANLRGGGGEAEAFAADAYDWCINLGAPAALIAGAVIATLYENIRGGHFDLRKGDTAYIMAAKKTTNFLLLSAFALQIISIFVTTVTSTMLRARDFSETATKAHSALSFMRENFEFEYLTSRLSFLQGLIHWLCGVALEHTIPRKGEGQAAKKMDQFVAVSLFTLALLLLSFYNTHLTFYGNYFQMLLRWGHVTRIRFFGKFRPMMILYIPGIMLSIYKGVSALQEGAYSEERDD
jgi:hypothetical protein